MSTISVRFDGESVKIGLKRLGDSIPEITEDVTDPYAKRVVKRMSGGWRGGSSYAVSLPRSGRNVRTGNYGASTTYEREGMTYRFSNTAYSRRGYNYGPRLTGRADGSGQAWWARGRWPVAAEIVREESEPLVTELDKALQRGIEAVGL